MDFRIIEFATPEFDQAIRLRDLVLRKPLNMQFAVEDIAAEYDSHHLGIFNELNQICAVLVVKPLSESLAKVRQVAVHPDLQKQGLGKELMKQTELYLKQIGFNEIELNARINAVPFYKGIDYKSDGPIFTEIGIDHQKMLKSL